MKLIPTCPKCGKHEIQSSTYYNEAGASRSLICLRCGYTKMGLRRGSKLPEDWLKEEDKT